MGAKFRPKQHKQTNETTGGKNRALGKGDGGEAETGQDATDIVDHDASEKPNWEEEKNGASATADIEAAWVASRKHGWKPKRNGKSSAGDKPENKSAVGELVRFGSPRKACARKSEEASAEGCAYEQDGTGKQRHEDHLTWK